MELDIEKIFYGKDLEKKPTLGELVIFGGYLGAEFSEGANGD